MKNKLSIIIKHNSYRSGLPFVDLGTLIFNYS